MTEDKKIAIVEETICKDKISELPEDLLVRILSLVPIKDAVATMFLSKRWLSIWTMIPTLEYKDNDVQDYADFNDDNVYDAAVWYKEMKNTVWNLLDKSMQLHKAPVIDSLCVKLGQLCPTDVDVVKWVANAVSRCLLDLEFVLSWSADPTTLPSSLYFCESLVKLTLSHKILVDVLSPACLPSLRELSLDCVVYKDEDSVVRLLSGCPVLKNLFVIRKKTADNVKKFTINVPSLLELFYSTSYDEDDDEEHALVINTPRLEEFSIHDSFGDSSSIENMPFLKCAYINLASCTNEKFLRLVCNSTIKFSGLLKLRICPRESDWFEPLKSLLENSPNLKELWVDFDCGDANDIAVSWNQPIRTPRCLSSQLETFKWKEYGGTEGEEQFLRYVLANSKCLNTAIINLQYNLKRNREEKHMMMEKLKHLPRASTTSQLLFEYISRI
ncbi:hypothetical protein CARUB_v10028120mg [Capsella rubella]|uniref:F-box domain-containing protein n=1 Tax=Capsella rubella TaxID=81985 RepID=R0GUE2_9BRAS|nr:hypothetical protein CARUB_v10028120mg [Capsella rubella]